MLNNMKIGFKLTLGFVCVLVLIGLVGFIGVYALNSSAKKTEEINANSTMVEHGYQMQSYVLYAQHETLLGRVTRDKQYLESMSKYYKDFRGMFETIKTLSEDKNFPANLDAEFMKKLDAIDDLFIAYDEKDTYWHGLNGEYLAGAAKRAEQAGEAQKPLNSLIEQVLAAARTPERAKTIEGVTYVEDMRLDLVEKIGNILFDLAMQRRNALDFDYNPKLTAKDREELKANIGETTKSMLKSIDEVNLQLTTPLGRETCESAKKAITAWKTTMEGLFKNTDEMNQTAEELDAIAKNIVVGLQGIMEGFNKKVLEVQKEGQVFDVWMIRLVWATCIFAVLLGLLIAYALTHNITSALVRATGAMRTIADEGNVNIELSTADMNRKDEVGEMAHAVSGILKQFQHVDRLANDLAAGNYRVESKVRGDLDTMNINLNKMLDQVNHTLNEINNNVKQVATGSGEVSSAAQSLSSGAQEAAASLEEITASMSEISSQTKANAESATQARDLAFKASKAAAEGQDAMQKMTGAMEQITKNSSEIQRVIKVIDDIAFQTNLLALNAAVEAARAGQHGKGFAVVAEEVRNLASRSAKAAQETSELIAKSGHEIEKGGEIASHTATVLNAIVDQIKQTTDLVAGIAVASNEQAEGVNQVTIGLQQIDAVTQQNTASAEESASAAGEMSSMATNLQKLVGQFQLR
ncbi:MAG: methyl-accepting chemotaxis protein [Planctomycetaceae bacterium]|nr:methyl-accepting chemotaxis protein [Planctomycetaceae bacterium]